jgi:hypothetical protein
MASADNQTQGGGSQSHLQKQDLATLVSWLNIMEITLKICFYLFRVDDEKMI